MQFPELEIDVDEAENSLLRVLKSWLSSAAIHVAILLVLLLWTIPIVERGTLKLTAFLGDSTKEVEEISFSIEESELESEELESAAVEVASLAEETAIAELTLQDVLAATTTLEDEVILSTLESPSTRPKPGQSAVDESGDVADATTVEAAVDRVTGGIRGALGEGDVLVVWLLDASLSLKDDRQRVANRLEQFLEDLSTGSSQHALWNSVVSFGRRVSERASPTKSSDAVLAAIKDAPTDDSGVENVFTAVGQCVSKYRRNWKKNLMIVVWTDESGDDVKLLDKSIERCKQGRVSVSVVGPSSVLGAETGFHVYRDPQTRTTHQLPVNRGPDSAMPERIRLAYWHPIKPFRMRGRMGSWLGGRYLSGISSGFSPYALTRLAIETGGSYTIFDRPEDRAPFDFDRLAAYAPSYVDQTVYETEVERHPLRLAVHRAVAFSSETKLTHPPLALFNASMSNGSRVFPYITPRQFASKLTSSSARLKRQAKRYGARIERALALVSTGGNVENGGMDSAYAQEDSPRWRAWYDLTRGRLLACSVRAIEYELAIDQLSSQSLQSGTNAVVFRSMSDYLSQDSKVERRIDEAVMLLERCVRENPNTPWEYLAQLELDHDLGFRANQLQLTPVGGTQSKPRALPKF